MTSAARPQRRVDARAFRAGIRDCFPQIPVGRLRVVGGLDRGWSNETCFAGDDLVFQTPIDGATAGTLEIQRRLLPRLAPTLPCRVPDYTYYALFCPAVGGPMVGYHRVKGRPLSIALLERLAKRPRRRLAAQIGDFLRALHAFPVADARAAGVREEIVERMEWVTSSLLSRVETHLPARLRHLARARMAACVDAAKTLRSPLILIHSDLVECHLIVDNRHRLTGVIDWGSVTLGDLAYELANPLYFYGREFIEEILEHYPDAGDACASAAIYAAAIPIGWMEHAVDSGDADLFKSAVAQFAARAQGGLR